MTMIACIDDRGGMLFGGRRQSQDRILRDRILNITKGHALWMSAYSAAMFGEGSAVWADDGYADQCKPRDYCFVENGDIPLAHADRIVLYRWNRRYPADRFFPIEPLKSGYTLVSSEDFIGSSHEVITEDIYVKESSV